MNCRECGDKLAVADWGLGICDCCRYMPNNRLQSGRPARYNKPPEPVNDEPLIRGLSNASKAKARIDRASRQKAAAPDTVLPDGFFGLGDKALSQDRTIQDKRNSGREIRKTLRRLSEGHRRHNPEGSVNHPKKGQKLNTGHPEQPEAVQDDKDNTLS